MGKLILLTAHILNKSKINLAINISRTIIFKSVGYWVKYMYEFIRYSLKQIEIKNIHYSVSVLIK